MPLRQPPPEAGTLRKGTGINQTLTLQLGMQRSPGERIHGRPQRQIKGGEREGAAAEDQEGPPPPWETLQRLQLPTSRACGPEAGPPCPCQRHGGRGKRRDMRREPSGTRGRGPPGLQGGRRGSASAGECSPALPCPAIRQRMPSGAPTAPRSRKALLTSSARGAKLPLPLPSCLAVFQRDRACCSAFLFSAYTHVIVWLFSLLLLRYHPC